MHAVPVNTEAKRKAVAAATTAEQLWKALGVDCWAVVPIASVSRPGHDLEGTRLTVRHLTPLYTFRNLYSLGGGAHRLCVPPRPRTGTRLTVLLASHDAALSGVYRSQAVSCLLVLLHISALAACFLLAGLLTKV